MSHKWPSWIKVVGTNILVLCLLLALIEGAILFLLYHPHLLGEGTLLERARYLYHNRAHQVIQYLPACAQYDSLLTYRLRPGQCTFSNIEFDTRYTINKLGLRDDEVSSQHPKIIALGDSHTMGWGVNQHETFAELLESHLDNSVLNAGISSYGTVRALKLLEQLPRDSLKVILLQYSQNDVEENKTFSQQGKLPISSRSRYESLVEQHARYRTYFFVAHLYRVFRSAFHYGPTSAWRAWQMSVSALPEASTADEVFYFLHALRQSAHLIEGKPVIVFEIPSSGRGTAEFTSVLRDSLRAGAAPGLDIYPVAVHPHLDRHHYFRLDTHMHAEGHEVVASVLARALPEAEF